MSTRGQYRTSVGASTHAKAFVHTLELKQRYDNATPDAIAALMRDLSSRGIVSSVGNNTWDVALKDGAWARLLWYPDWNALEVTVSDRELHRVDDTTPFQRYDAILNRIAQGLQQHGVTAVGAAFVGLSPDFIKEDLERLHSEIKALGDQIGARRLTHQYPQLDAFYASKWLPFYRAWRAFYDDIKDTSTFGLIASDAEITKNLSAWQAKLIDARVEAAMAGGFDAGSGVPPLTPSAPASPPPSAPPAPGPGPVAITPSQAAAPSAQTPPGETSNTRMYIALGVGAVALTALTIFAATRSARSA